MRTALAQEHKQSEAHEVNFGKLKRVRKRLNVRIDAQRSAQIQSLRFISVRRKYTEADSPCAQSNHIMYTCVAVIVFVCAERTRRFCVVRATVLLILNTYEYALYHIRIVIVSYPSLISHDTKDVLH